MGWGFDCGLECGDVVQDLALNSLLFVGFEGRPFSVVAREAREQ